MMIALLLLLGAQNLPAPPARPETMGTDDVLWLDVPNDIARAMVPYMSCYVGKLNVVLNRTGGLDAVAFKTLKATTLQQCARVRVKAKEKAERILAKRGSASAEERSAVVEKALEAIENANDGTGAKAVGLSSGR